MNIGLIRVLTLSDQRAIDRHGSIIESAFPGLKVTSSCIENHPKGLYDKASEEEAKPKIIGLAKELEKGVEAIIVSCAADPAVVELKETLNVPAIGAGESLAAVSRTLGTSVGVLSITDNVLDSVTTCLGNHFLGCKKVDGVETALDLMGSNVLGRILNAARALRKQGSNVIALACTGFSTIGVAQKIGRELGIPVVDPVFAAGSIVYNLMLNKESPNVILKTDKTGCVRS